MPAIFPGQDLNGTSKATKCSPRSSIPNETASYLKEIAGYASWHAANHMKQYRQDAQRDEETVRRHYNDLCHSGVFSPAFCFLYEEMAWAAAWSTANERMGSRKEAAVCKQKWMDCHGQLFLSGEVTGQVANDLRDLCWFSGWFTANTRKGIFYTRDAAEDARKIEMYCNRIVTN